MKKEYKRPEVEYIDLLANDVIASNDPDGWSGDLGNGELPNDWE